MFLLFSCHHWLLKNVSLLLGFSLRHPYSDFMVVRLLFTLNSRSRTRLLSAVNVWKSYCWIVFVFVFSFISSSFFSFYFCYLFTTFLLCCFIKVLFLWIWGLLFFIWKFSVAKTFYFSVYFYSFCTALNTGINLKMFKVVEKRQIFLHEKHVQANKKSFEVFSFWLSIKKNMHCSDDSFIFIQMGKE